MTLDDQLVFKRLRETWQPVANADALIPGGVIGYTLLETELVIARFANGTILAADVACPHKGARLSAGCIQDGQLTCPYHGWTFTADGKCQSIPSLIEPSPEKLALAHLRSYPAQERYGFIWVKLDQGRRTATFMSCL